MLQRKRERLPEGQALLYIDHTLFCHAVDPPRS
jgi:hypothetical protein